MSCNINLKQWPGTHCALRDLAFHWCAPWRTSTLRSLIGLCADGYCWVKESLIDKLNLSSSIMHDRYCSARRFSLSIRFHETFASFFLALKTTLFEILQAVFAFFRILDTPKLTTKFLITNASPTCFHCMFFRRNCKVQKISNLLPDSVLLFLNLTDLA